jgi:hypothetical protein
MKGQIDEAVESSMDVVFEARGKETDESLFVPTVPIVEGVFMGRGFPVLRSYDEFSQDARWLNGLPVMMNHEEMMPDSRRVGQMGRATLDGAGKRVKSTTEFIKQDLTPRELANIKKTGPDHGSLRYMVNLEHTPGVWNGKHYDAIERSPYVFLEYSYVREGVVTPADGAGFKIESVSETKFTDKPWDGSASKYKDTDAYCAACLIDYNESGKPKIQAKCKLPVKEPDGSVNKNAIRNALARIGQLKGVPAPDLKAGRSKLEKLAKQAKIGESGGKFMVNDDEDAGIDETKYVSIEEFEELKENLKDVSKKNETLEATIEADQKARDILAFRDLLKPGYQDEAADLWEAHAADPMGWLKENVDKLLTAAEENELKGKPVVDGASDLIEEARTRAKNAILRKEV